MKSIICATVAALFLSGCTAGDLATARGLTVDPAVRRIQSNNDARHAAETDRFASLSSARRTCTLQALKLEAANKFPEAEAKHLECAQKAKANKPDLVTVDTIRKARNLRSEE